MPRFSVAFGRRRSTVTSEEFQHAPVATSEEQASSSFRVLERSEVAGQKSFDGGHRLLKAATTAIPAKHNYSDLSLDDNMFTDIKNNRGSGSSNTTKTTSTDTSSRHSNVSTTPSSADFGAQGPQEEWKSPIKKSHTDLTASRHNSGGFLSKAGRTFSFGGQKKHQASASSSANDHPLPPPPLPHQASEDDRNSRRPRGLTESTASTATPPKLSEEDFALNFGSDFGNMFQGSGFDKRASQMTLSGNDHPSLGPRSLTTNRVNQSQPSPIKIDNSAKVEASPYSWSSQHSNENLLHSGGTNSPTTTERPAVPPPVPRHGSPLAFRNNVPSDIIEDEDANLLKDSIAASRFLGSSGQPSNQSPPGRFRRNEDTFSTGWDATNNAKEEENMFDDNRAQPPKPTPRHTSSNSNSNPPRNKVMTPAEFEKYRRDKERRDSASETAKASNDDRDDDEDQYEDDEDDIEKAKQAAKQRRKQEAHMAVYRQQMMKVTGESPMSGPSGANSRPSLSVSLSTPNLPNLVVPPGPLTGKSDASEEEDEEVPLAILAAHGFPNKNKPPARMMNMASNPDLRSSAQAQSGQPPRPGSSMGEGTGPRGTSGGHLPAFARKLPQDPFLGAGLINAPARESLTFGGGSPAPGAQSSVPVGGLVGVIASEERSRAMRRGSPNIEAQNVNPFTGAPMDPVAGVPPQMMYSNMNGLNSMAGGMGGMPQMQQMAQMPQMQQMMPQMMLTPGDQAQIQMTQQMQQFMQMQMQFMQMMATPNPTMNGMNGMPRPMSHVGTPSINDTQRQSYFGDSMLEPPRLDPRTRTMSMVQPSSSSWIQPGGFAPSIHGGMGGGGGYAPSILAPGAGYAPSIAPSERSNVGLPGRYRPVTQAPQLDSGRRMSVMSGAMGWDQPPKVIQQQQQENKTPPNKSGSTSDDDDEEGWAAMKAKKEKKRGLWRTKKSIGSEIGALIS
ncbi:hypothetical protein CCHL11_05098 [Colletotrichum chlorophyti]|uniref:Uncharacterized protein n=1 Tax=Colletotrichum chlorophyti TaxID=708187 RepID=A0A1Q8S362_9PEZI|nr:hypothetical protein CCHL11_05098 [Colletotrichum chlorophyti]